MFPGRWPNYPKSMWSYGWSAPAPTPHQPAVPPGQFCGSDPSFQQSQAQAQAQISALQQQNALLNQQLHNQSQTHINHLQQLLPHHQVQQQPTPTPPSVQPPPATPVPSAPEPPSSQVATPSPPTPTVPFNPEEMLNQMKTTFEASLAAVVEKTQDRQPHHAPQFPPPKPASSLPTSHQHLSPGKTQHQSHSSRRSRSLRRHSEPPVIDKRPLSLPRSPKPQLDTSGSPHGTYPTHDPVTDPKTYLLQKVTQAQSL